MAGDSAAPSGSVADRIKLRNLLFSIFLRALGLREEASSASGEALAPAASSDPGTLSTLRCLPFRRSELMTAGTAGVVAEVTAAGDGVTGRVTAADGDG